MHHTKISFVIETFYTTWAEVFRSCDLDLATKEFERRASMINGEMRMNRVIEVTDQVRFKKRDE